MVLRANIVLAPADGVPVRRIASQLKCAEPTVRLWRRRFVEAGLEGLEEGEGRGRRAIYGREGVERVLSTTISKPLQGMTHWSTWTLAEHLGLGHSTVQRIWKEYRLQPHRSRSFKFSKDPELDKAWSKRGHGRLGRYADDGVVLWRSREEAGGGPGTDEGSPHRTRAGAAPGKDADRGSQRRPGGLRLTRLPLPCPANGLLGLKGECGNGLAGRAPRR